MSLHFKTLELQGFKSFPEKTVLHFDANITAVVGPNGSGKSNLSDAIRWVMGEQSTRALRGGKMEDVIFGGTGARKSLGFAQVSLTLDNEDHSLPLEDSEIVVTRRYYRSGESEYYINRRPSRLKDIHELFMDTGLGQDGYCLVGQGKIDEILSVKSTQRREIFEEAAGISRYRHRKEEAERKLSHTKENLLRIGDKLEELELQREPLRQQADKARAYFRLQEELRILECSLWMDRLATLRREQEGHRAAYAATTQGLEEAQRASSRLYEEAEALQEQAFTLEASIEAARQRLSQLEGQQAAAAGQISVLRVQIQNHRETIIRLGEEQNTLTQRGFHMADQVKTKKERLQSLLQEEIGCKRQREAIRQELAQVKEQLHEGERALEVQFRKAQEEQEQALSLHRQLSALEASQQEVALREEGLVCAIKEAEEKLTALQAEALSAEAEENSLLVSYEETKVTLTLHGERLVQEQRAQQQAEEALITLRMEENALESRIRLLEDMERSYEGYSKAVKTVMEDARRGNLQGVHGPVAGLLRVPKDYTIAIEIALGGALQHLVVETEEDGKAVLWSLKRKNAGRVTCLPRSSIRPSRLDGSSLSQGEGYVGIAADLVDCDKAYESIVSHLLGRVVIVRDLDSGIAMARKNQYRHRIVTLDGQLLSPGGAMTGGSAQGKGGILSRAKELKTLKGQKEDLARKGQEGAIALEGDKERTLATKKALEQIEEQGRRQTEAILVGRERTKALNIQREGLARQLEGLQEELERLRLRTKDGGEETQRIKEQLSQKENGERQRQDTRLALEAAQKRLLEQKEALTLALGEESSKLAVLASELRSEESALLELEGRSKTLYHDQQKSAANISRMEQETKRLTAQLTEEEGQKHRLETEKEGQREALSALHQEKLALEGRRNQTERDSRSQNEKLLLCQKEAAHLEQKLKAEEQEEGQLLARLWDQYELSHEGALAICQPVEDRGQAERRILSIKGEIRTLGHVNPAAVEEFERINERYEYLQSQKQDVEEAAASLTSIIEEIVGSMKTIFRREFGRINEAFSDTFVELFQGGEASLHLEDERDILNCGIEIRVQPPGKSLKNLNLLSGGEKAFVAIALYFAILKIRPTPFCVLDEIEAALDDVNVNRFARYLRRMARATQFIVITHRRGTMEEADVLYGVTMQQQGISRILRMDMKEAELGRRRAVTG